jgi:general secretion pathway protein I
MKKSSHYSGFTLLEVMVAMAILAIALVAVLRSQSQSISMANEARLATMASMLTQSKIAEIDIEGISAVTSSGDFGEDFPNYRWEVTTTDTDFKYLKKIDLAVTWKEAVLTREYHITFYRYVPDNT